MDEFLKYMQITAQKGDILTAEANLLAVGVYQKENWENDFVERLNDLLGGKFKKLARMQDFEGKIGQSILFSAPKELKVEYILVLGLGNADDLSLDGIREATGVAVQRAKSLGQSKVALELFGEDEGNSKFNARKNAKAIAEAAILADYRFTAYKKPKRTTEIKELFIVAEDGRDARSAQLGINAAHIVADGVTVARDLVNTPANNMSPTRLAETAENIAKMSGGNVKVKILNKEQCEKKKMGAYLAVAQGSDEEPKFIHLTYRPEGKIKKKIALVGKGVTFDSGGLSLKSSEGMMTMKCDMAGAATVLGVFATLARIQPKAEIHGIVAATENMPSGKAIRPGDVVRASNGKTIEILNTDAEGRLTLADGLHYACKLDPDYIIDLATLTGACVVALGEEISGIMGNDPKFVNQLITSSTEVGEKLWEMPLEKRYRSLIESDIADVRNIAKSRYGGSLTAGLFLQEFVEEGRIWAHLDIAGPAFAEKPMSSYIQKGASGFGVRTLVNFLESI
jgi:leucyl aminopeptidase